MIRKLLLLSAVMWGCSASPAFGLGLGELELNSALNQQFSAEIELTNIRGLEVEEIIPNLASQEDFNRVGVERNYLLTDLRFKVDRNDQGNLAIFVTSSKPIIEPFLNFIVEVLWPTGRILREYTVLLDPPVFGQEGIEPVQPGLTAQRQAPPQEVRPEPVATPRPRPTPVSPVRTSEPPRTAPQPVVANEVNDRGDVVNGEYGMTGQGDTLWNIALRVRPNNAVSVQQTMLALQRANPEAFINNNINLLKAGYVLRIPDVREIRSETVASAVQAVRNQNREFTSYREGGLAQLDATRRQAGSGSSSRDQAEGELKLVASDDASGERSGAGGSARTEALQNELAVAKEDLDRARRANSELNIKIEDLQQQLDMQNEILTAKDDLLAALKAEVQKMQAADAQAVTPAPAPTQSGGLFSNPLILGLLGFLLVAALVGGMLFMRRRQQTASLEEDFEESFEEIEPEIEPEAEPEEDIAPEIEEEEEDLSPETNDVIGEVEIYIAYGRFPQAITFLQNAIQAEPDRADIQLKLLEVYAQTEDSVAFNLQLEQLRQLGDEAAIETALELQKKIPGAAEDAAAAMDATIISTEPVEAIVESQDDDDDLSFDLDDLDSETEDDELDLSAELDLDEDLDLSLDADEDDELTLEGTEGASDTLQLDADDIELELEDPEADKPDSANALDDDTFELDLDDDVTLDLDDEITLELDDDSKEGEISLDLDDAEDDGDDDVLDLSTLEDDDDFDLEKDLEAVASDLESASSGQDKDDDDALSLDLDDDLELDLDDDVLSLETDADLAEASGAQKGDKKDDDLLNLDDDDDISLELDDGNELSLEDDDDALDLDLDDDISLDLDDDELDLDLDDDGTFDLTDEDDNKIDLARAYMDMGDSDGARNLLEQVIKDGSEAEKQEASQLLEKID